MSIEVDSFVIFKGSGLQESVGSSNESDFNYFTIQAYSL